MRTVFEEIIGLETRRVSIIEELESYKVDFSAPLPPIEPILQLKNHKTGQYELFGTKGNFSLIKGKAKTRKSFLINMIISNAISNNAFDHTFNSLIWEERKKILVIDTEQSDWHVQNTANRICRLSNDKYPEHLFIYKFRSLTPAERLKNTERLIHETEDLGLVVIDGIRDLITSINDEAESTKIASHLLKWSEQYNIHIITVLHENPTNDKARGHLGTELTNKAETVAQIEVDSHQPGISIVKPFSCRNKEFEPFAFNIENNDPQILIDFDASRSNTKERFDVMNLEDKKFKELVNNLFAENPEIKRNDLKYGLQNQLQIIFPNVRTGLGLNKMDQLVLKLENDGLIFQETKRKPYRLKNSNS